MKSQIILSFKEIAQEETRKAIPIIFKEYLEQNNKNMALINIGRKNGKSIIALARYINTLPKSTKQILFEILAEQLYGGSDQE